MKILRLIALAIAPLLLLGALASCNSSSDGRFEPGDSDKLTAAETAALVAHARAFIAKTKFVDKSKGLENYLDSSSKRSLTAEERSVVNSADPQIRVRYAAPKAGQLAMSWQVSPSKRLILLLDGDFLAKRQNWELQIVTTGEAIHLKNGERVEAPKYTQPRARDAE